jgi:hypothetical protein
MEQLERCGAAAPGHGRPQDFRPSPRAPKDESKRAQRQAVGAASPGAGRASAWAQVHARLAALLKRTRKCRRAHEIRRTTTHFCCKTRACLINAPHGMSATGKNGTSRGHSHMSLIGPECMVRPCVARELCRFGGERSCINVSDLSLERSS